MRLNPILIVKEKIFYVLTDESIRKSVEDWQGQAKRYFEIREIFVKEVQRIVDEETDNRMKDIHVDNPTKFRNEVSGKFDEFWKSYYFSRLIRGQVEDGEYSFILNLKGSNDPDIVKFATGFPKAVYERIDEKLVQDLNKAIGDTQNSFSKLKEALGKEISKIK